jgi:TPR repeat protein
VLVLAGLAHAPGPARTDPGDDLYRDGHHAQALAWWRQSATRGGAHAAYRLGAAYADGDAVQQDFAEAARWLRLAAEAGHRRAQFDLATLYDAGRGVDQSFEEAARWYRAGAERGEMASQFNLGSMYEQGHGVERNLVDAYKWYSLAARQGFPSEGVGALEALAARMTPAEIERGAAAVRDFEPTR